MELKNGKFLPNMMGKIQRSRSGAPQAQGLFDLFIRNKSLKSLPEDSSTWKDSEKGKTKVEDGEDEHSRESSGKEKKSMYCVK